MLPLILRLPLEVWNDLTSYLFLDDFVNLRDCRKALFDQLKGEEASRAYVMAQMNYSEEGKLARNRTISYSTAIQRAYVTRKRFARAEPFSVVLLSRCPGFYYGDRAYCYGHEDCVRILDVYSASKTETVVDVRFLLGEAANLWPLHEHALNTLRSTDFAMHIKNYQAGILTIDLQIKDLRYIVVINVRKNVLSEGDRVRKIRPFAKWTEQYVCTDGRYMILANYSEENDDEDGHTPWVLECYDLENIDRTLPLIVLSDVLSIHYREEIDFRIIEGWFYLLCNYHWDHVDSEDRSRPTHCYYCYRFPIEDLQLGASWISSGSLPSSAHCSLPPRLEVIRIRRQHHQLPPGESSYHSLVWISLQLHQDERAGAPYLVEGWQERGNEYGPAQAHYYFQSLIFLDPAGYTITHPGTEIKDLVHDVDAGTLPHGESPFACTPRLRKYATVDSFGARGYAMTAAAFNSYDIRLGKDFNADANQEPRFHLGVRSRASNYSHIQQTSSHRGGTNAFLSTRIKSRPEVEEVRQFPAKHAPEALLRFLSPYPEIEGFGGASTHDTRSILYFTGTKKHVYRTILLNFDAWIQFPGLQRITSPRLSDRLFAENYEAEVSRHKMKWDAEFYLKDEVIDQNTSIAISGSGEGQNKEHQQREPVLEASDKSNNKDDKNEGVQSPSCRTERAMWMNLQQGFQFSE